MAEADPLSSRAAEACIDEETGGRPHDPFTTPLETRNCVHPRTDTAFMPGRDAELDRLCFAERVGNATAESKQDGSGQHRGKRTAPPDGVWRGLQEKATNRRAERQGDAEGQAVERQVAAEQMGWSHVRD